MRIFKTKWFARFARKEKIAAERLHEAVLRAGRGNIDADLGGSLIKQRVGRLGQGRSGGYRTLIAFHTRTRSVFLYGFAKSQKDNVGEEDLDNLKKLAARFLALNDDELRQALEETELIEVLHDEN